MSSDVFQPSQEPLILRGAITTGASQSMDVYKKTDMRPQTQGGYRFGHLSHNSFFARHNPHPGRVRHIKGLLDVPICSVNDNGFVSNPRYAPSFPPNSYANNKLSRYNVPSNSINVNTQLHPINTITGLQYFLGKPMNMRIFRERMATKKATGGVSEAWHDELKALTEALCLPGMSRKPELTTARPKTQYSETTGRLIPPPSRAMSRGGASRSAQREFLTASMGGFGLQEPNSEDMVLGILAQILQTDDIGAVQQWLVGAGDREKSMVLNLIKQAMESKSTEQNAAAGVPADYSAPALEIKYDENDIIGDNDMNDKVDRLTLEPSTPLPRPPSQRPMSQQAKRPRSRSQSSPAVPSNNQPVTMRFTYTPQQQPQPIAEEVRPVSSGAAFRASRSPHRPPTQHAAFRPQTSTKYPRPSSSTLRTPSPLGHALEQSLREENIALKDVLGAVVDAGTQTWTPPASVPASATRHSIAAC